MREIVQLNILPPPRLRIKHFLPLSLRLPAQTPLAFPPPDAPAIGREGLEELRDKIDLVERFSSQVFAVEFLKRFAFCFRDEKRGEDAAEHEEGEDLHDVVEPGGAVLLC